MKKNLLVLIMTLLLVFTSTTAVFADAAIYDMEKAGYYVYVKTPDGGLNIRSGPSTEYERIMPGRIPDNVMLYIEYVSNNWGYTSYNGYTGWVALSQTTTTPPTPPEPKEKTPVTPPQEVPKEDTPQEVQKEEAPVPENEPKVVEASPEEKVPAADVPAENNYAAQGVTGKRLAKEVLLIVIIIVFVIITAVLLIVIVNLKSRR